jgi:hypothetical protein
MALVAGKNYNMRRNNNMNYLTNYYKNLSEQLQAKVNRLSSQIKLLNESANPDPDDLQSPSESPYSDPYSPSDPYWRPKPPDDEPAEYELEPLENSPSFDPRDPNNPPSYEDWLRQHPEPNCFRCRTWEEWDKLRKGAENYYEMIRHERAKERYYQQYGRWGPALQDFTREIMPDIFNPFGN